jgi:hypothetical protein
VHTGLVSLDSPDCSCVRLANSSGSAGAIPANADASKSISPTWAPLLHGEENEGSPTAGRLSFDLIRSATQRQKIPIYTLHSSFLC